MWALGWEPFVLTTYVVLLLSVIGLWVSTRIPYLWTVLLAASLALGYLSGVLTGFAFVPVLLLAAACWLYRHPKGKAMRTPAARGVLAVLILGIALLLGLGAFPGFHNPFYAEQLLISPSATPYTSRLNFDKTLAGLLILGLCYRGLIAGVGEWRDALRRAWPVIVINVVVVIALALALGFVRPEPKWTTFFIPWAVVNLFFVCLSEEAFFRGFIQRELADRLSAYRYGQFVAIVVSAVLFGLAHFAGGLKYVLLSTVAGVGYAFAFQRSGRIEMAMLAHFSLNATHFLLLTYPTAA